MFEIDRYFVPEPELVFRPVRQSTLDKIVGVMEASQAEGVIDLTFQQIQEKVRDGEGKRWWQKTSQVGLSDAIGALTQSGTILYRYHRDHTRHDSDGMPITEIVYRLPQSFNQE